MGGGDILNRTGKEGSVLLREETINSHKKAALLQHKQNNHDLRVRKAGAFKRLEPVRHLPITQQDVNDHSWDVTMERIGKVVQRQAEIKASHCPPRDKYKYWNGMPDSINMQKWMGTRQMSSEETPFYGIVQNKLFHVDVRYLLLRCEVAALPLFMRLHSEGSLSYFSHSFARVLPRRATCAHVFFKKIPRFDLQDGDWRGATLPCHARHRQSQARLGGADEIGCKLILICKHLRSGSWSCFCRSVWLLTMTPSLCDGVLPP
ncbi:unnamed protein product [Amoebophrya sp. A120]|nr:unnamed protein product [Amoebophrya sp. A120]|eukprot:GSA120T00012050001.1